ncbi:MAG: hypothetical protein OJF50_006557 [Nitrospira sp.]|nr:hypothetical protein [Nitrospira sp.]
MALLLSILLSFARHPLIHRLMAVGLSRERRGCDSWGCCVDLICQQKEVVSSLGADMRVE